MAQILTVTCDVCGKVKAETNRWWTIRIANAGGFALVLTSGAAGKSREYLDVCGEECALARISQEMAKVKG